MHLCEFILNRSKKFALDVVPILVRSETVDVWIIFVNQVEWMNYFIKTEDHIYFSVYPTNLILPTETDQENCALLHTTPDLFDL